MLRSEVSSVEHCPLNPTFFRPPSPSDLKYLRRGLFFFFSFFFLRIHLFCRVLFFFPDAVRNVPLSPPLLAIPLHPPPHFARCARLPPFSDGLELLVCDVVVPIFFLCAPPSQRAEIRTRQTQHPSGSNGFPRAIRFYSFLSCLYGNESRKNLKNLSSRHLIMLSHRGQPPSLQNSVLQFRVSADPLALRPPAAVVRHQGR